MSIPTVFSPSRRTKRWLCGAVMSSPSASSVIAGQEAESWLSRRLMSLMLVWQSSLTSVKIGSCVCIKIVCWKVVCCVGCREAAYW